MLVPDRVAQVLNLNLDGVVGGGHKQQHKPRFIGENGKVDFAFFFWVFIYSFVLYLLFFL